jgi:hypothetical protein
VPKPTRYVGHEKIGQVEAPPARIGDLPIELLPPPSMRRDQVTRSGGEIEQQPGDGMEADPPQFRMNVRKQTF